VQLVRALLDALAQHAAGVPKGLFEICTQVVAPERPHLGAKYAVTGLQVCAKLRQTTFN
jgi:hypothetical protein